VQTVFLLCCIVWVPDLHKVYLFHFLCCTLQVGGGITIWDLQVKPNKPGWRQTNQNIAATEMKDRPVRRCRRPGLGEPLYGRSREPGARQTESTWSGSTASLPESPIPRPSPLLCTCSSDPEGWRSASDSCTTCPRYPTRHKNVTKISQWKNFTTWHVTKMGGGYIKMKMLHKCLHLHVYTLSFHNAHISLKVSAR